MSFLRKLFGGHASAQVDALDNSGYYDEGFPREGVFELYCKDLNLKKTYAHGYEKGKIIRELEKKLLKGHRYDFKTSWPLEQVKFKVEFKSGSDMRGIVDGVKKIASRYSGKPTKLIGWLTCPHGQYYYHSSDDPWADIQINGKIYTIPCRRCIEDGVGESFSYAISESDKRFRIVISDIPGRIGLAIHFECERCGSTVEVPVASIMNRGANVRCHSCQNITYVPPNAGKE